MYPLMLTAAKSNMTVSVKLYKVRSIIEKIG